MGFGQRVRDLRRDRNMTQGDVAQALGVTRPTVTTWEAGKSKPHIDTLEQLAKVLGTTSAWLLNGDDEATSQDGLEAALVSSFRLLNEDGQRKVCDYALDLVEGGRYRAGAGKRSAISA